LQVTTKYKIPTKYHGHIRSNKYYESPESKHSQPEATYGRASDTKTKGEKNV